MHKLIAAASSVSRRMLLLLVACLLLLILYIICISDHPASWTQSSSTQVTRKQVNHSAKECITREMLASYRNYDDVSQFDTCRRIFYNRVPKCASRTILSTMRALAVQHSFKLVSSPRGSHYSLNTPREIMNFTKEFHSIEEPFLYSKHLYFFNFTDYGMPQPVYINVIRDPLERAVSHYYYSKYGSHSKPVQNNATLNETGQMRECVDEKSCRGFFHVILPFFCGHKRSCSKYHPPEDRWLLVAWAKQVIRQRYLVVGLTEDISGFMEVLESYMPSYFKNATNVFNDIGGRMKAKYRTVKKAKLDTDLEEKLKKRLAADYDLYGFVKQRFYNQLKRVRTWRERRTFHHMFKNVINGAPIKKLTSFVV